MVTKTVLSTTCFGSLTTAQTRALESYMPDNFLPKIKGLTTISQVLENKTSSISKIKKSIGVVRTEALLKVYLVRTNELLGVSKPLSEEAIDEIASILLTEYYMLSMTDIAFVLQQAVRGRYGELYESLTIPKVIKWFRTYFDERCQTAEEMSNKERSSYNSLFGRERMSDKPDPQRDFSRQWAISQMIERQEKSPKE